MQPRLFAALVLALVLPATADEPAWIYRGRLGDSAILERAATGEQLLVPLGAPPSGDAVRPGVKVLRFAPDAVELEVEGKAVRLAIDTRPAPRAAVVDYPHEVPAWWADHEAALAASIAVDWRGIPVERALDELAARLERPVALTPRALVERARSGAPDAIDLRTGEHPASKLLDLIATVLDLAWWPAADGVWLGPAAERPAPPREVGVRAGLARARDEAARRFGAGATLAGTVVALDQRLEEVTASELVRELPAGELPVAKVLAAWADRAGARLVVDAREELGALDLATLGEGVPLRAAVVAVLAARERVLATDGNALLVLTAEAARRRDALAEVEAEAARRGEALMRAARETPLGAMGTLDVQRLVAALEKALGQPVYADRASWSFARSVALPSTATVGDAFGALVRLEVFPVWVDERLYLVRAE